MYKFIVCDLDGNLLNNKRSLGFETVETLDKMFRLNKSLIIATGRSYSLIPDELFEIKCLKYLIGCNGAVIYDKIQNKTIYEHSIEKEISLKIIESTNDLELSIQLLFIDEIIANDTEINNKMLDVFVKSYGLKTKKISNDINKTIFESNKNVLKFDIFGKEKNIKEAYMRLHLEKSIEVALCGPTNIEITRKDSTKGKTLKRLVEYLNISKEDILCFGDSGNDLSMKYEGFSFVAPNNASLYVKNKADYIIGNNFDDGVAKEINRLMKNKDFWLNYYD